MNIKELKNYLNKIPNQILDDAAEIVAETATEYFKETFTKKAFDGNPWQEAKKPKKRGSLLIDSGALLNSIRPVHISKDKVIISAGNNMVGYAKIHNEGYNGIVNVPSHIRHTKGKNINVVQHQRQTNMPTRQFMGDSKELRGSIKLRIENYINSIKL